MKHGEEGLQQDCIRWFDYQYASIRNLLHHSPNGGKRNAREAGRFKAMGTRAGFPDIVLFHPDFLKNSKPPLFIEFKYGKGTQTDYQKAYESLLTSHGYIYTICKSFDEFKAIVEAYLKDSET